MPNITEMLLKLEVFQCVMSIYLNIGYYHILINEEASNLCTIILPWLKFHYKCLPTGVSNSLDILQKK